MDDITKKLLDMKEKVSLAETESTRLEGRLQADEDTLKNIAGTDNLEQAEKKLEELTQTINTDEVLLSKGVGELEHDYDWR